MINLILLIILLVSLMGILTIIFRKISVLTNLTEQDIGVGEPGIFGRFGSRIKGNNLGKLVPNELFLHRILSKFRVIALRSEAKISSWLNRLRQRSIKKDLEKKDLENDYWQKMK